MENGNLVFINGRFYIQSANGGLSYAPIGFARGGGGSKKQPKDYGVFVGTHNQNIIPNFSNPVIVDTTIENRDIFIALFQEVATSPPTAIPAIGSYITLTISTGLSGVVGRTLLVTTSDPFDYFIGQVTAYNPITGDITMLCTSSNAAGEIYSNWSLISASRITCRNSGVYNLQFSLQFYNESPNQRITIWLRINGADVPFTLGFIDIMQQFSFDVPAWNFVSSMKAGDYFELFVSCDGDGGVLAFIPPLKTSYSGTITASIASPNIAGTGTLFEREVGIGTEIYSGGNLVGGVASITDNFNITLQGNAFVDLTNAPYGNEFTAPASPSAIISVTQSD